MVSLRALGLRADCPDGGDADRAAAGVVGSQRLRRGIADECSEHR